MTFTQNGWDKTFKKLLTPYDDDWYITDEGVRVTVLPPEVAPEAGHWIERGDIVYEIIGDALDDIASAND